MALVYVGYLSVLLGSNFRSIWSKEQGLALKTGPFKAHVDKPLTRKWKENNFLYVYTKWSVLRIYPDQAKSTETYFTEVLYRP